MKNTKYLYRQKQMETCSPSESLRYRSTGLHTYKQAVIEK